MPERAEDLAQATLETQSREKQRARRLQVSLATAH